ncbi:MAG: helix-turn-helix transcriptional regulator [Rhodopirellula sp.]|nr:helix-turn-helix transcriptional regulator [Rhodopirellula sp.]
MVTLDVIPPDATEPVHTRALISLDEAGRLARLFKIFANETRLRLLHALVRDEELCVGDLADALSMKPQAVSNQLQRLVNRGILASRRDGTSIYYHIVDPCVPVLLERGLCLTECCPEGPAENGVSENIEKKSEATGDCCTEAKDVCCSESSSAPVQATKSKSRRKKATGKIAQSKRRRS